MKPEYININRQHLKAASRIMAKQDIRYYLNGVHVEATKNETVLVATDGHRLIVLRDTHDKDTPNIVDKHVNFIIPDYIVKMLTTGRASNKLMTHINIEKEADNKYSAPMLNYPAHTNIEFKGVEGTFPDYHRIIPKKVSGEAGSFNPKYIMDFERAAIDIRGSMRNSVWTVIHQNGPDNAAIILTPGDDSFLGIVMPFRADLTLGAPIPDWVNDKIKNYEEAAAKKANAKTNDKETK